LEDDLAADESESDESERIEVTRDYGKKLAFCFDGFLGPGLVLDGERVVFEMPG